MSEKVHHSRDSVSVAPSLEPALENEAVSTSAPAMNARGVYIALLAAGLGVVGALVAWVLTALIGLVTNLVFYQRVSIELVEPAGHALGGWVVLVPVIGGLIVGVMARYGSAAIRGHGIPEAMEKVLLSQSRIPARVTLLKPLSSAIAIGTGGPFGAEGPIIATGGSLGSLLGQALRITASERKVLLAAGAAAGMTAIFGTPIAAVFLAVELLLFELRPRSLVPVSIAAAIAAAMRVWMVGPEPVFPMPAVDTAEGLAIVGFVAMGLVVGGASVAVTRLVYAIEEAFARLPIHWMWWPALGAVAVGVVGFIDPRTLGVGYTTIESIIGGELPLRALAVLCTLKLVSWSISLGSGTSGGTLAPLFIVGGGAGALVAAGLNAIVPGLEMSLGVAGLVGMAAMFAGASRAFLSSVVFAFETTHQPATLVPLLAACTASYMMSYLFMKHSIMTEKIARRGVRVSGEYAADYLDQRLVSDHCTVDVVTLRATEPVEDVALRLAASDRSGTVQAFPVTDDAGAVVGVVMVRDLLAAAEAGGAVVGALVRRRPIVVSPDSSLREAADLMVSAHVGRLVVVESGDPRRIRGIITRSDILAAHHRRLREDRVAERTLGGREVRDARR